MAKQNDEHTVVVLGASPKEERYSNQAVKLLQDNGYYVIPVNPGQPQVHGIIATASLEDIKEKVDTLTLYVNPTISSAATDAILRLAPSRIIFNPGTENTNLAKQCKQAGIEVIEACTLVLLRTGQF